MRSASSGTNPIDKRDLSKFTFRNRDNNLPSISIHFIISYFWKGRILTKIHIHIFNEWISINIFSIDNNFDFWHKTCHIVGSFSEQHEDVIIKLIHAQSCKVREESYTCKVFSRIFNYFCLRMLSHIIFPNHFKFFTSSTICTLHNKLFWKYICKFSAITISTPNDFFLIIIIVASCE